MKTVAFCRVFAVGFLLSVLASETQGFYTKPGFTCRGTPADIVFVLDSSTSIWNPHFKKQLEFANYMVDHLDIGMGHDQVRVGVETFSDSAYVHINLDESRDKARLKQKIGNIVQETGNTNIGDALNRLLSTMFKQDSGARYNVPQIAILLTDGTSQDQKATQRAARACRDANIQLFVIGIGEYIDHNELRGIASKPHSKFLYNVPSYDALDEIRDHVIQQTCEAVTTPRPPTTRPVTTARPPAESPGCRNKKADVFFLIDSSSSIEIKEFKKEINVVEDIVSRFDIGPTKTRVGVSVFGHEYYEMLSFDAGSNKMNALHEIHNLKYLGGGTETGKALNHVRNHIFNQGSLRAGADRILIVFTDGQSKNYEQTSAEGRLLREAGIKVFVVGIGPYVDRIELKDIASKPTHDFMHTFDTFDILLTKTGLLTYKACTVDKAQGDQDICNATQRTDVVFMVSNNHFGKDKTNRILKSTAEVMRKVRIHGSKFQFGSIFDNCLPKQDMMPGSILKESELVSFNYGSISSIISKLRLEPFSAVTYNVRQVGLLFLDSTIDLNDSKLLTEVKRATFRGIELYPVIIGDGVDMKIVETNIAPRNQIIKIFSYNDLVDYLPSQFTKTVCKRSTGASTFKPDIS